MVFHTVFILFAMFGALLLLRWPKLVWLHLPALAWGLWIELAGGICPLTPLENGLREQAGDARYNGGFIEHYIVPVIYPPGLTHDTQLVLAAVLIILNAGLYALFWTRRRVGRG